MENFEGHKCGHFVWFKVLILLAITAIISKDGVTFIKYSQQIESAPVKTMVNEDQHPGYPLLILAAYKVTGLLNGNTSILSWIYCAQSVTFWFLLKYS